MYQVKNAMSRDVISIRPEATLGAAIQLLLDNDISGAPVIDAKGRLRGIITQFQLLEVVYDPNRKNASVEECMTRDVLTIDEDAMLGQAANLFIVHRIRRLPVMRGSEVVGIISRKDLLRYSIATGEELDAFFSKLKQSHSTEILPV
jgi:CBS domain-containing protein